MPRRRTKKEEEIMRRLERKKRAVSPIPLNSIRSIEELAKLSENIKGLGLGYLCRTQIEWLYSGGFEYFEETKPVIYELLEKMEDVPGIFPLNLREMARMVEKKIRSKVRKGEIDKKWKDINVSAAELDTILRFKRNPFSSKGERIYLIAKALVEVLEEEYRKEKKRHKVEEPEIRIPLEVAKEWLRRTEVVRGSGSLRQKEVELPSEEHEPEMTEEEFRKYGEELLEFLRSEVGINKSFLQAHGIDYRMFYYYMRYSPAWTVGKEDMIREVLELVKKYYPGLKSAHERLEEYLEMIRKFRKRKSRKKTAKVK